MKIRNGFISNSSSSSFILERRTVYQVASYMLERVINDSRDIDFDAPKRKLTKSQQKAQKEEEAQYRMWERNLRKAAKMQDVKDGKIGVVMPSCNYETYIIKKDDLIYISTSHNHEWDFADSIIEYKGIGADDGEDDKAHKIIKQSFFYNLRNGLIHSCEKWRGESYYKTKEKPYCNTCKEVPFGYVETLQGEMLCSKCYKGGLGKTPEKIVEELMEASKKNMSAFRYLEP